MTYGPITQQHERERLETELDAIRQEQLDRWFVSRELSRYRAMKARERQQLECAASVLRGGALDGE